MGAYTYGSLDVDFSRPLTEQELAEYVAGLKALAPYPNEDEGSQRDILGDDWDVNGESYGDIGKLEVVDSGFTVQSEGKVYEIPQAVRVFIERLPADVTVTGEGIFETEGDHWAIRVRGREVLELEAELRIIEPDGGGEEQ